MTMKKEAGTQSVSKRLRCWVVERLRRMRVHGGKVYHSLPEESPRVSTSSCDDPPPTYCGVLMDDGLEKSEEAKVSAER